MDDNNTTNNNNFLNLNILSSEVAIPWLNSNDEKIINDIIFSFTVCNIYDVNRETFEKAGITRLMLTNDTEVMEALIRNGENVNARDVKGRTPLMFTNNIECAKVLIKHGADANIVNNAGFTAWQVAEERKLKLFLFDFGTNQLKEKFQRIYGFT